MRIVLAELGQHATTQALGGKLDGGERVLDLVCEAACDFGPGGFAAGAIDHGGIVENRDRAFVGQACTAQQQDARASIIAIECHFLAPLACAFAQALQQHGDQGRSARCDAAQFGQRPACVLLGRKAEHLACGGVHAAHLQAAVDHQHAGGQVCQYGFQKGTLALGFFAADPHPGARELQFARHAIERAHQKAEFVVLAFG